MKPNELNDELINNYDYLSNAASSQDMTGLIPAATSSEAELEFYEELFHFLPPNGVPKNIHP